jgi:hypothetical protein
VELVSELGERRFGVIGGNYGVAVGEEALNEERAHPAGTAGDEYDAVLLHFRCPQAAPSSISWQPWRRSLSRKDGCMRG